MASFKHDEAGFLLGELVKSGSEQGRIQRAQAADLRAIRADIRKLAGGGGLRANGGSGSILKNKSSTATQREAEKSTAQAVEKGTRKAMEAIERSSKSAPRAKAEPPPAKKEAPATIERTARLQAQQQAKAQAAQAKRDGKGRFTKGGGKDDSEDGGAGLRESSGLFKRLEGLASIGSNANQLDPALTAANEVREAVAPIGRGLSTLFGGESDRKKERWYKRIWKELKDGNKAQANAPRGGGGGGGLGAMGLMRLFGMGAAGGGFGATIAAFLAKIPAALGFILTRIFAPIAGIIAAWNVGQWLGTKIYEWLEKTGIGPAIFDPIFRAVDGFIESAQNGWDKLNKGLGDVVDGIKSISRQAGELLYRPGRRNARPAGGGRCVRQGRRRPQGGQGCHCRDSERGQAGSSHDRQRSGLGLPAGQVWPDPGPGCQSAPGGGSGCRRCRGRGQVCGQECDRALERRRQKRHCERGQHYRR